MTCGRVILPDACWFLPIGEKGGSMVEYAAHETRTGNARKNKSEYR